MGVVPLFWWVSIAFAAQAAAANLAGFWRARRARWGHAPAWRAVAPYVRALYFVGPPYVALVTGAATPRLYGLVEFDWPRSVQIGAPILTLGFAAGGLLIWLHGRVAARAGALDKLAAAERRAQLSEPWGAAFVLLDTISLQAHWLFYRAGATVLLGDAYLGALAGMALVALEWAVDMRWWLRARTPGQPDDLPVQLGLLVLSTALIIYTRNFWFVLAAHALVWLGWLGLMQWSYRTLTATPPSPAANLLLPGARDG